MQPILFIKLSGCKYVIARKMLRGLIGPDERKLQDKSLGFLNKLILKSNF